MEHEGPNGPEYWQETAASEVARMFFGHPYMIDALGRLLPPVIDVRRVRRVLDVGCGHGEWARRLVRENPHMQVIGVDTSLSLIQEAIKRSREADLEGLTFYQFKTTQALAFPSESFDIVHVHSLASFISTAMWSRILDEMIRLLKIGGWLNIVDYEHGTTSSAAFNRLAAMGMAGVRALGGSIAPASPTLGVAARLYGFLVDAGLIDVAYSVHALDYGVNSHPGTRAFLDDFVVDMLNFKPFVLQLGLTDSQTFDALLKQTRIDFYQPDSCGYAYLISAVGRKEP
ncbi:MAG TPA: methyltransferase domain-containing protein [Ktedonobacteraceae bacterium]|nr:methyltransferase domain-containing protein [Ktedonobacteraceae bacterium]